jgi:tyrosine-protein phosphatase SIW14
MVSIPINTPVPSDEDVSRFLAVLAQASGGATLVHCEHGRSRTGMMVAAYRVLVDHWTPERALGEFNQALTGSNEDKTARTAEFLDHLQRLHSRTGAEPLSPGGTSGPSAPALPSSLQAG